MNINYMPRGLETKVTDRVEVVVTGIHWNGTPPGSCVMRVLFPRLSVYIPSVSYTYDKDYQVGILNIINDPIVTNPYPERVS